MVPTVHQPRGPTSACVVPQTHAQEKVGGDQWRKQFTSPGAQHLPVSSHRPMLREKWVGTSGANSSAAQMPKGTPYERE